MRNSKINLLIPISIGFVLFWIICGFKILDPTNIRWLEEGDPQQHYLGWLFFRNSDWNLPLGANPRFGLEISSSIAYSDSLPLFAFIFKIFSGILPDVFQYFGIWILLCFVLQTCSAWILSGIFCRDLMVRTTFSFLCGVAPPFLWRLHGHISLFSHFLILFALIAYFEKDLRKSALYWVFLIPVSILVHAYIAAIVLAIWAASLLARFLISPAQILLLLAEVLAVISLAAFTMWQAGYFIVTKGTASGGFGFYRMNLLSLIDPDDWSFTLKDIPGGAGDYEGFNFLGMGVLLLCILLIQNLKIVAPIALNAVKQHIPLFLALVGLTLFALSNNLGFGPNSFKIGPFPVPDSVTGALRSSGRMFWPVFYVILLATPLLAIRSVGRRAYSWMACAVCVQIIDTSAGWTFTEKMNREASTVWASPMKNLFWTEAANRYESVAWLMPENHSTHWQDIAYYAGLHRMGTNAVYLARVDEDALQRAKSEAEQVLTSGQFDKTTLYILDDPSAQIASDALGPTDMLAAVDGFNVLAPGCDHCADEFGLLIPKLFGPTVLDTDVSLIRGRDKRYLGRGWCEQEEWGIWSCAPNAILQFEKALPEKFQLSLEIKAFGPSVGQVISVETDKGSTTFKVGEEAEKVTVNLSGGERSRRIEFHIPTAKSPKEMGINADERKLGIGILNFKISEFRS